jgi:hypothetical protein
VQGVDRPAAGKEDAAEKEAKLLAAVVEQASARAATVCRDDDASEAAQLHAAFDMAKADAARRRLRVHMH